MPGVFGRAVTQLQHILDRIESLFLSWCDPNTPLAKVQSEALRLAKVHHEANVPPSWVFQVMVKVWDKARLSQAPAHFFVCSNLLMETLLEDKEKRLKDKEQDLQEEQESWQEVFNNLTEGVCLFGLDGTLYDMNDAYCNLVGYTKAELFQKGWLELTPPEYRDEEQRRMPEIMAGQLIRFEKEYLHKDGHRVPILISYRLLKRRANWDQDHLIATCVDLSKTRAQQALIEERLFWQQIFNAAPSGMLILDEKGDVLDANETYIKMHGFESVERFKTQVQQKGIAALTLPKHLWDQGMSFVREAIMTGKRYVNAFENIKADGATFPVLDMIQRIMIHDRVVCILAQTDLTEIKAKEQEIGQLLEDAQDYLGRLAAAMLIHDSGDRQGTGRLLQETYNRCVDNLQALIGTVVTAAQALMASSKELAQSQATLSDRANQGAASLEEISANATEISAAVSENAKHAHNTQELAESIVKQIADGKMGMNDVVEVMFSAAQGARETTVIAKAIQDIAFTTNILSLNASVEAARAGQYGRGFAIIASEIRRLASQANDESKKAQRIIAGLLSSMETGEKGVQQVATVMDQIESKSHTMAEHVKAIAEATKEQDEGLKQIAQGINALEEGLSQNAAMAEEIYGTAEGLQTQTDRLLSFTQQFELDRAIAAFSEDGQHDITAAIRTATVVHFRWRQRLFEAARHGKTIDPAAVGDFHHCTLGQMLAHNAVLQAHPAYGRIHQLHEAFHREGQRIAELLRTGQQQQAIQALQENSRYNELTETLIQTLEDLSSESSLSQTRKSANARAALQPSKNGQKPSARPLSVITNTDDEWEAF